MLVLLAMRCRLNIAGWGPREGAAAWAFAAAGLGAAQGVATARRRTACWCFAASLPGAAVLLVRLAAAGGRRAAGCRARRTSHG